MSVYLICFEEKYHHAKHYIGYACDVQSRLDRHQKGEGAKLLRALNEADVGYEVVRIWEGADRNFERKLKKQKNAKRYCPICSKESSDKCSY